MSGGGPDAGRRNDGPGRADAGGRLLWALGAALVAYLALPLAALLALGSPVVALRSATDPVVLRAATHTLATASASTLLALLFGVPLAHWLARTERRVAGPVTGVVAAPLVLPPVVSGLLLLTALGPRGLAGLTGLRPAGTLAGVVLAQTFVAAPFVVFAARSAFAGVDDALLDAARSQGASEWRIFRRVSLPLARRGVLAGATLSFARAAGEFGATLVVAYHPRTLPVQVWVAYQGRGLDRALPVALVLAALALAALATLRAIGGALSPWE